MTLAEILESYNLSIGNDDEAFRQIARLKDGKTQCVVTGQQLGMCGGPLYTLLKGVTCLQVAEKENAVPVFWLATEDHDIAEIDHAFAIDAGGDLQRTALRFPKEGKSVDALELSAENLGTIRSFLERVGVEEIPVEPGERYSTVMARYLVRLFAGTGMVFIEPKQLRPLGREFFRKEILSIPEVQYILKATTRELEAEGVACPLDVSQGSNLFLVDEKGVRKKIVMTPQGLAVGDQPVTEEKLLAMAPERLSTGAAARPLFQCHVLPTAAYVAGPTEIAYHRQLTDYFTYHGIEMPRLVPRLSATIITPKVKQLLETCGLKAEEPLPQQWQEVFPEIHEGMDRKAIKAFLQEKGISTHSLHYLQNFFHPKNKLQERVLNTLFLQGQCQTNLVQALLKEESPEHCYCEVS